MTATSYKLEHGNDLTVVKYNPLWRAYCGKKTQPLREIMAKNIAPFESKTESLKKWIVLCDGKKVQIFEQSMDQISDISPLFDEPLNRQQLHHELLWHYHCAPQSGTLIEQVRALLVQAYHHGAYHSLVVVARPAIAESLRHLLPVAVNAKIEKAITRDLTYCHKEAITSYFSAQSAIL